MLLGSGVTEEQNLLAGLAGVGTLDQLVVVSANVVDDVTDCHREEVVGVARIGDEYAPGPANNWPSLRRDRETNGIGEGLDDIDGGELGRDRPV